MALLPQNRWLDIAVEIEDVSASPSGSRILGMRERAPRSVFLELYSLTNPLTLQNLDNFIATTLYEAKTQSYGSSLVTSIEYQDMSTDRYPGGDNPYGYIYMMFTKTAYQVSPRTFTQHLNRLTLNSLGVVTSSDEFNFPALSKYLALAVDNNIVYVCDLIAANTSIQAFQFPTSGANLVRDTSKDLTPPEAIDAFEVSNNVPAYYFERIGNNFEFGGRRFRAVTGGGQTARQTIGVTTSDRAFRTFADVIFINDVIRDGETLFIQERSTEHSEVRQLGEYASDGSRIRVLGPAGVFSEYKKFNCATLVARGQSISLHRFKLRSQGTTTSGRTVVTDGGGAITSIIPGSQSVLATVMGLPEDLKALNNWSFDYDEITYTMISITSTSNPGVHEVLFNFAPEAS